MEPKYCISCSIRHFNQWDLCPQCSAARLYELERRLSEGDGALSLMTVASAIFGPQRRTQRAWWAGHDFEQGG